MTSDGCLDKTGLYDGFCKRDSLLMGRCPPDGYFKQSVCAFSVCCHPSGEVLRHQFKCLAECLIRFPFFSDPGIAGKTVRKKQAGIIGRLVTVH